MVFVHRPGVKFNLPSSMGPNHWFLPHTVFSFSAVFERQNPSENPTLGPSFQPSHNKTTSLWQKVNRFFLRRLLLTISYFLFPTPCRQISSSPLQRFTLVIVLNPPPAPQHSTTPRFFFHSAISFFLFFFTISCRSSALLVWIFDMRSCRRAASSAGGEPDRRVRTWVAILLPARGTSALRIRQISFTTRNSWRGVAST